jgi:hypothetical protein
MGPSKVVQAPGQLRRGIGTMEVFVFRNNHKLMRGTLPGRRTAITSVGLMRECPGPISLKTEDEVHKRTHEVQTTAKLLTESVRLLI